MSIANAGTGLPPDRKVHHRLGATNESILAQVLQRCSQVEDLGGVGRPVGGSRRCLEHRSQLHRLVRCRPVKVAPHVRQPHDVDTRSTLWDATVNEAVEQLVLHVVHLLPGERVLS